jgi:hypothetical protein
LAFSLPPFLETPQRYLNLAGQNTAVVAITSGYRPLLHAQVAASQRIQMRWQAQENADRINNNVPISISHK